MYLRPPSLILCDLPILLLASIEVFRLVPLLLSLFSLRHLHTGRVRKGAVLRNSTTQAQCRIVLLQYIRLLYLHYQNNAGLVAYERPLLSELCPQIQSEDNRARLAPSSHQMMRKVSLLRLNPAHL